MFAQVRTGMLEPNLKKAQALATQHLLGVARGAQYKELSSAGQKVKPKRVDS